MPGIAGIISKRNKSNYDKQLSLMIECMRHEPFYRSGKYQDETTGVYIAWTALQNSFSDGLPIWNEQKNIALFFYGENYINETDVACLRRNGNRIGETDAQYLIHLYEEYGERFYSILNGRFHGVIVNQRDKEVILFNDRLGMQRVYFHETAEELIFSSEAKAILAIRPKLREIEYQSLGELISVGCVLKNKSLFKGIHLLPAASQWTYRKGQELHKAVYFTPHSWENQPKLDAENYYQEIRRSFPAILERYLGGREKIGISLTGGLDTRMIMAWLNGKKFTFPCYTFSGPYRESFDVKIARKVAAATEQRHEVIKINKDFFTQFPKLAANTVYITDGTLDVTGAAELYVNRLARSIAPVRMTGNYGSEVLRAHRAFKPVLPLKNLYNIELYSHIETAAQTYYDIINDHKLSFAVFKQAPWFQYSRLALEQSQLTVRSPFLDNDFLKLVYQAPDKQDSYYGKEIALRLIKDGNLRLALIPTDRGDGGGSSALVKLYLEILFKAEYVYNYGMPQWLAQLDGRLRALHIEKMFLGRHKFYHYRLWYRDVLAKYMMEIMTDTRALNRSYINKKTVENIVRDHTLGKRNYTNEITQLLTVELIHRSFID